MNLELGWGTLGWKCIIFDVMLVKLYDDWYTSSYVHMFQAYARLFLRDVISPKFECMNAYDLWILKDCDNVIWCMLSCEDV